VLETVASGNGTRHRLAGGKRRAHLGEARSQGYIMGMWVRLAPIGCVERTRTDRVGIYSEHGWGNGARHRLAD